MAFTITKKVDQKESHSIRTIGIFRRCHIRGSVIASYLYTKVPKGSEGYLHKCLKIVSRDHLNELGKYLDLIRF